MSDILNVMYYEGIQGELSFRCSRKRMRVKETTAEFIFQEAMGTFKNGRCVG